MRKIREILKLMLPAAAIAVTVYFAADAFFMRVQPEPAAPSPTAESAQEEAWTKEEEEQPAEENQDGYACSRLGEEDALLYRELYEAVTGFVPDASLSVQDAERIERVFACVMADHPEIFYVDGYTLTTHALGEDIQDVSFQAEYTFTRQQAQERLLRVEEKADAVLSTLTEDMDDYEKLKTLYESIVTGTEYDLQAPENQTICSVFLYGKSVCQGYAKAFQYLCQRAGIPAVLVTGTVEDGSPHAWTAVCCSGEHEECTSILNALEGVSLPQSMEPDALYNALNHEETPLPARDLEPDFGRFDELTGEERAALTRQASENVERRERSRLRLRMGLAAVLVLVLCAGTALGLWIHSENTELTLFSGMGSDVVFLDTDVPNDNGLLLAEMEMEFPTDSPIPSGIYRIPF